MSRLHLRVVDLLAPLVLLASCLSYFPGTLLRHPFLLFTSPRDFQSEWFASFWGAWGPTMAASPEQIPYIADLVGRAKGTVLELGPGAGDQMRHFAKVVSEGKIDRVYGAEPNAALHGKLLANAREVGLDPEKGKYVVLEAGGEPQSLLPALRQVGLLAKSEQTLPKEGLFDTIICVKSMCSAPQHEMGDIVATIQALLKPGGEFLFFEHVDNGQDRLTMTLAWVVNLVWPIIMAGCHLNGKVDVIAKNMTGWSSADVRNTHQFQGYNTLRYVVGVCKKP